MTKTVFRSDRTGCNDRFCTLVYLSTLSQTKAREQCPDVQGVTPLECPSSIIPTTNNSRWTVWKKVPQITQTGHRSVSPQSLVSRILTKKNIWCLFSNKIFTPSKLLPHFSIQIWRLKTWLPILQAEIDQLKCLAYGSDDRTRAFSEFL